MTFTYAGVTLGILTNATTTSECLCGFNWKLSRHWFSCQAMQNNKKLTCVFCGHLTSVSFVKSPCTILTEVLWMVLLVSSFGNTGCFGLACAECKDFPKKKQKDWTHPNFCKIAIMNEAEMK